MSIKWIVIVWCGGCLAGLLALSVSQLEEFDPESRLSLAITDIEFEGKLISRIESIYGSIEQSIIHFSNNNCFCETIAKTHIEVLSKNMLNNGFQNIHINIDTFPEFSHFVPSTPSVAIVGTLKELIYFGPYSQGYGCLKGTGLVDALLPKIHSDSIENSILITDAQGCYCKTASLSI